MAVICPTITANDPHQYRAQIERVTPFTQRLHIDLMDGEFAPTISPDLSQVWLPHETINDIHLMYQRPMDYLERLIELKPHLVIIHNEADVHHMHFAAQLHAHGIEAGLALLQNTPVEHALQVMHSFDHVLIFSGNLGRQGGSKADLALLGKVRAVREHHPEAEIGWDGGVNADNINALVEAGVDVLNVGGFIQSAADPAIQYQLLVDELAK
ncbi:MAG TPA: hypothetical protein VG992_04325 [Candidatus Saccharimonadales bacterium]|nr:hypothetical protein [Candidatus Saccharimonadales bacterium]